MLKKDAASALSVNTPNPDRIQALRRWHIDQATCDDAPVAALHVSITAGGQIRSSAVSIEPEHAAAMLPVLAQAYRQVQEFAAKYTTTKTKEVGTSADNVVSLRAA